MRIERVELHRFGHFDGTTVALDHPEGGLRFVVGPNEAGKSTLRSALRAGLFGFEGRTVAGRPAAASALALHLVNGESQELVVARQGMGAPRDAAGQPIDKEVLARWVPLTREAFDRLYCLGHDELRRYGPALLQSGEDLGRIVFGAALGGTHVQRIGSELASQLEGLYAPGARARKLNKAIEELTGLDAQLRSTTVTADTWEALRAEIEKIEERLASRAERNRELAQETTRLERIRRTANARSVLREHRGEREHLLAEGPASDASTANRIASLLEALDGSATTMEQLRGSVATLEGRRTRIGTERAALEHATEITSLHQELGGYREAVDRIRRHELDGETSRALPNAESLMAAVADYSGVRSQVDALREMDAHNAGTRAKLDTRKVELGLAGVRDEAVAALGVPTEAQIESAREGASDRAARRKESRRALGRVEHEFSGASERLRNLDVGGAPLPSDGEIAAARSDRDGSWSVLRTWFVTEEAPSSGVDDRATLAEQVHGGIERADTLVDRVRADTARAAEMQAAEAQLEALRELQKKHEDEFTTIEDEERAALEAWEALWEGVEVRIGTPSEMSTWRNGWRELFQDVAAFSSSIAQADQRRTTIEEAAKRLRDALDGSGHAPPAEAGVLATLDAAEKLVEQETKRLKDQQEAAAAKARIRQIEGKLVALLPLLAPDARSPGDRAIEKLYELRNQQASDQEASAALDEQVAEATEALQQAREERERLDANAREEAQALGVGVDRLPEVVARAEAVADLQRKIDTRKEQLLDAGDGLGLEQLHVEAEAAGDLDVVAARLGEIVREQAELELDRTEATRRLVEVEGQFEAIAGGDEAAALHEARARALSRIEDLLEEIAVLTLATSLLEQVVEAARTTGRGPLIQRASHYFELLTDAAFEGLDLELHGEQAFPVAVRADGSRLYADALSDGTLDQLWLAWRLAGVEHHIDQMGPVPLIVDDVLVNFDDERAGSAFRALASLATRTQVLVLTHHPHLVGIARERLGQDNVVVAQLEARPEGALAVTQVVSADRALGRPPVPTPVAPSQPRVRAASEPTGTRDATVEALRTVIDGEWRGKAALIERSGIASNAWNAAIKTLLAEEFVEQRGAKRGARYRRTEVGEGHGG